jgi:hypothetical protein
MAVDNPWTITYGSRAVGGTSDTYLLHEPYVLDKSFGSISVTFEVIVVATSFSNLQSLCDDLETDFRKRDQTLVIDLDGSTWTYTFGTDLLNSTANIAKSGDSETDRGLSRSYTCSIEGELPADDASPVTGLRDLAWAVSLTPSRQTAVTMTGVYTATKSPAQLASVNYLHANGADAEATTFLAALDGAATFELVGEDYAPDRNNHTCEFTRTYIELLANQTAGALDATDIRGHTVTFTQQFQQPGDSDQDIYRLRRVVGSYECGIDIDQTTDLQSVFTNQVKPHVLALFQTEFSPQVFCVEDQTVSYDETAKRMAVSITFLFQTAEGGDVVQVTATLGYSESRALDFTPTHSGGEYDMYVDVGWSTRLRTATRSATVVGDVPPGVRLGGSAEGGSSGWHTISSSSDATNLWAGDPGSDQILLTVVNETLVEQWAERPSGGFGGVGGFSGRRTGPGTARHPAPTSRGG